MRRMVFVIRNIVPLTKKRSLLLLLPKIRKLERRPLKPFPDPNNRYRWFIEHSCAPEYDSVIAWYKSKADYEKGLERYASGLRSLGEIEKTS